MAKIGTGIRRRVKKTPKKDPASSGEQRKRQLAASRGGGWGSLPKGMKTELQNLIGRVEEKNLAEFLASGKKAKKPGEGSRLGVKSSARATSAAKARKAAAKKKHASRYDAKRSTQWENLTYKEQTEALKSVAQKKKK